MAKNNTTVNGLSPVTKVSKGKATTAPDVCKTPVGSAIVPIPYPNVSQSSDLAKGSTSVKINGAPACLSTSEFSTSTGDEAGSAKGLASGSTKGKAHPVNYSFTVKIEGKPIVRNTDLFTGNNRNTPPLPIVQPQPTAGTAPQNKKDQEKKCPRCGAIWKKTEPTLTQVRNAVKEVSVSHKPDIKRFSEDASYGYLGSVATGKVGNPEKPHMGMPPDIRGECGTFYDIDGCILSKRANIIRKRYGKRWASSNRNTRALEKQIRISLQSRNELQHMKKGKGAFSIVLYLPSEKAKITAKGCKILFI